MEITLEMAERLKQKANVTYAQAKEALEYSGGNMLDALIYLEEKGIIPREEGAYYSTKSEAPPPPAAEQPLPTQLPVQREKAKKSAKPPRSGPGGVKRFFHTLRRWLVDNELEIWRKGQPITALPVPIPILLPGLFLGVRYRVSGPDLERDDLNSMIGSVADTAADLGRQVMDELRTQHDKHTDNKE